MKKRRNEKGFTLVEVIVVAVIVAVLAAVAIPLYMGYIKDSRINVGDNVAGTLASAAGATVQQSLDVPVGTKASPTTGDPLYFDFPSVSANVGGDALNRVIIPSGFTAILTATTATCYYTTYGETSAKVITFKATGS